MARCYVTGQGNLYGRQHTHHRGVAGGRWKKRAQKTDRLFRSNLQTISILEDGVKKQVKVAAKVIKRIRKDIADGKKPILQVVKFTRNA